jgi:AAA+ ATPase superfamily predicted ATPase
VTHARRIGVLHDEINRLLREEMPSAIPLRPILDAIGLGAHRSAEIAGRLQTSATSLTRSLKQLQELGYVRREVPYGQNEKSSKKAIYKLADPFLRLWFRVVASHRGSLQAASKTARFEVSGQRVGAVAGGNLGGTLPSGSAISEVV